MDYFLLEYIKCMYLTIKPAARILYILNFWYTQHTTLLHITYTSIYIYSINTLQNISNIFRSRFRYNIPKNHRHTNPYIIYLSHQLSSYYNNYIYAICCIRFLYIYYIDINRAQATSRIKSKEQG